MTLPTERFQKIQRESPAERSSSTWCKRPSTAVGAALQDVAVSAGAAVGAARHALPPVRGAAHHRIPKGLLLRQARRHAPPQGRAGPRHLRVLAPARGGARLPRRRRRALPRGVRAPRGRRHRRRRHRRGLGGGAQARATYAQHDRSRATWCALVGFFATWCALSVQSIGLL
jgi:hypothetical protein